MADELLVALAGAWDAIRARHQEVQPVVLVVGSNSRPTAKRRTFARFAPTGWGPPPPSDSGRLNAGLHAIDEAIQSGDHDALRSALAASAQATLLAAAQVSREAEQTLSEVLVTEEGLARGPAEVLETLLHEAARSGVTAGSVTPAAKGVITTTGSKRSPKSSGSMCAAIRCLAGHRAVCPPKPPPPTARRLRV
jgi:hypothetical protein